MSGLVGIVSLFVVVLTLATLIIALDQVTVDAWTYAFLVFRILALIASVVALTLATSNRLRGAWSITGLVTGLIAFGVLIVLQVLYPLA